MCAPPSSKRVVNSMSIQAIYDKLYARRWDSSGYEVTHVATRQDVERGLDWLRNAIIDRKVEIDASVKSGRSAQIIDQMRAEFRSMSTLYDEVSDELAALDALPMAAE